MRKRTNSKDIKQNKPSEAKAAATRRATTRSSNSQSAVACSSFTLPIGSQIKIGNDEVQALKGKAGVDWFQVAACAHWNHQKADGVFKRLRKAKEVAQERRKVASLNFGSDSVSVTGSGTGGGRDSHKEIQLIWNDARVGLSERDNPTRQLSNASLLVSGGPCLIVGASAAWEFFQRYIQIAGGEIIDAWIRRLDICVDVPGLSFNDTVCPVLTAGNVVTRCRDPHFHLSGDLAVGYSIGNSSRLRVLIYDKLHETRHKHDPVYVAAMIQRRWGGVVPLSATRFEWQMGRAYLTQFGLDTVKETVERLPDLYSKLTDESGGAFRITTEKPDRENGHQSRAVTHPIWDKVVQIGRQKIGEASQPLTRLDRSGLDESRAIKQIIGNVTSIADRRQIFCGSKSDLLKLVKETMDNHQVDDELILESFRTKAQKSGTWQHLLSFPKKEAA